MDTTQESVEGAQELFPALESVKNLADCKKLILDDEHSAGCRPNDVRENIFEEAIEDVAAASSSKDSSLAAGSVDKKPRSSVLVGFLESFEREKKPDEKIRFAMHFMRSAISQQGTPRFKDFWEVRRLCLPLFKENLSPKVRVQLWAEYIELSSEARQIKEILDEQSSFAVEQIELAISALEKDLEHQGQFLSQGEDLKIPDCCLSLMDKKNIYNDLQKELNLLNTMASKVNALRKEVIKTEMRVRYKNRFFDRLSACGDRVFPRRKELIKQISEEFSADVEKFVQENFSQYSQSKERKVPPLFVLRDEIKALQIMAKELTLNTHAFTETRLHLSKCWDIVRDLEKDRKKDFLQKKQIYKQNSDQIAEKIKAFGEMLNSQEITQEAFNKQTEEIQEFIRSLELGRDEIKFLRDLLYQARKPFLDKEKEQEKERERLEKEEECKRQEQLQLLRSEMQRLLDDAAVLDMQALVEKRHELQNAFEKLSLSKAEKQIFERLFKQIKDQINEKREKAMMSLSSDDLEVLEQLKMALQERKQQRQEIKDQLEQYRKALAGSGLDFEKAITFGEFVEAEKERLNKTNTAIREIEEKILDLEG